MNAKIMTLGVLLTAVSFALPGVEAHWVDGAGGAVHPGPGAPGGWFGPTTHEHAVITGSGYTAGYFAQRICADNAAVPNLFFSDGEGNCGPGTHPLIPPIRGFSGDLSLTGCLDLTLPTGDLGALDPFASGYKTGLVPGTPGNVGFFKNNPHTLSPSTTWVVDAGDVDDSFLSGTSWDIDGDGFSDPASTATMPVHAASGHGNGAQTLQSVSNRFPPDAALRYIAGDGVPAGAAGVAARQDIRGQDIFGSNPDNRVNSVPGARPSSNHATPGQDNFDNDWETGEGDFCFTYAIDNAPDAFGSMGVGIPPLPAGYAVTVPNLLTNGPLPGQSYDGCQDPVGHLLSPPFPAGPGVAVVGAHVATVGGGCAVGTDLVGRTGPLGNAAGGLLGLPYCGAGADWNDPVESGTTRSLSLSLGLDPPVPFPISPKFTGTVLNQEWVPHPIGNDGVFDSNTNCGGGLFNPLSAHTNAAGVSNTVGKYGVWGPGGPGARAMPVYNPTKGVLLAQYLAGAIRIPTWSGAAPINTPGLFDFPISYSVCNNVGEDGCTNIPIEGTMNAPAATNWQGHVTASLQQCVYSDRYALPNGLGHGQIQNGENTPNLLGAGTTGTGHIFQGEAMKWGDPTYTPSMRTCWPERLGWSSLLNVWVPHSQSVWNSPPAASLCATVPPNAGDADNPQCGAVGMGAPGPAAWVPDWAPATARDIEYIQGDIQLVQLTPFAGATICPPFTSLTAFPGCVAPTLPTGGWTVLGQPLVGLAGGWIDGYAAVFT